MRNCFTAAIKLRSAVEQYNTILYYTILYYTILYHPSLYYTGANLFHRRYHAKVCRPAAPVEWVAAVPAVHREQRATRRLQLAREGDRLWEGGVGPSGERKLSEEQGSDRWVNENS